MGSEIHLIARCVRVEHGRLVGGVTTVPGECGEPNTAIV